jgi:integrase
LSSNAEMLNRQWADLCAIKRVGAGARKLKDLRDSYASHLLSAGIPLVCVSKQIGHQSMQLTERHYAHWIPDGDEYQAPLALEPGEIPADLLACLTEGPRRPKTSHDTEAALAAAAPCR